MQLSEHNPLVRFAFLGADYGIPKQTSLCALFWRIVWRLVVVLTLGSLVAFYLYNLYAFTWSTFIRTVGILAGGGAIIGVFALVEWIRGYFSPYRAATESSAVRETIYAIKNRFCPIITITEE